MNPIEQEIQDTITETIQRFEKYLMKRLDINSHELLDINEEDIKNLGEQYNEDEEMIWYAGYLQGLEKAKSLLNL